MEVFVVFVYVLVFLMVEVFWVCFVCVFFFFFFFLSLVLCSCPSFQVVLLFCAFLFFHGVCSNLKEEEKGFSFCAQVITMLNVFIATAASSIGIDNLDPALCAALGPDLEYRLREIVQEAIKFMKHSKRERLTCDDVSHALQLHNVEQLFGYR